MKKQIISILLAAMLLCTVFPIAGFAVTMGDVNGDGKVTAADARWALRAAVELEILTKAQAFRADADFDGEVTPADSRLILRSTVGLQDLIEREMPDFPDKDEPVTVTRPEQPSEQQPENPGTQPENPGQQQGAQSDYSYLAGYDFRNVRRQYPHAVAENGYVVTYTDRNGDLCVMTYIIFKIQSTYSMTTLHNITTGQTIHNPSKEYDELARRAYGAKHLMYNDLAIQALEAEAACIDGVHSVITTGRNTGKGVYVDAATLNA